MEISPLEKRNALTEIVNMASKIARVRFDSLTEYFNKQFFNKAIQIQQDPTHPLYPEYVLLPSGVLEPPLLLNRGTKIPSSPFLSKF